MAPTNKKVPATLMLGLDRHAKLKAASRTTRISMSELVRISLDRLINELVDPERPNAAALSNLLFSED